MELAPITDHWYFEKNFAFVEHGCGQMCSCVGVGCVHHWRWKEGKPPPMPDVDRRLHDYGVYRNAPGRQETLRRNYERFVALLTPLAERTIFCDWDADEIRSVFEEVAGMYPTSGGRSSMAASKTLFFFVPDLFMILDTEQVWEKWKDEVAVSEFGALPECIYEVDGAEYVGLLTHVQHKISSAVRTNGGFTLAGSPEITVASVEELRVRHKLLHPQLGEQQALPSSLGKALDNIIVREAP